MTRYTLWLPYVLLLLLLVLSFGRVAEAQGGYDLAWFTIDAGGASALTSSGYTLSATIGQPDAGDLRAGNFELLGGFWSSGVIVRRWNVYLPLVLRGE